MPTLDRLAHSQNRRDELPNQQLARELAASRDRDGICEIVENLGNRNKGIQADCIKVLYEIGYIDPGLIAEYADEFVRLLHSHNNRMVWGSMIALNTVAELRPQVVVTHLDEIERVIDAGSVITVDNGIQALARAASKDEKGGREIIAYLVEHLGSCRSKDVPQHAEKSLPAINTNNKGRFVRALKDRMDELTGPALERVKKVVAQAEQR